MRGGDLRLAGRIESLMKSARDAHAAGLGFALSTFAGYDPSLDRDDLIAKIVKEGPVPHPWISVTTARALRDRGFTLVANKPLPSHVRVKLGNELTRSVVESFRDAFGPAEKRPVTRSDNA